MISIAALRLDDALRLPAVPHRDAHGAQAALKGSITDRVPLPDLLAQFLLGDYPIAMFDEIAERLKDLRRQPGTLTRPMQDKELRVQGTIGKAVEHTSSAAQWQIATGTCNAIEQDRLCNP
jgi:hypothetical protein